MHCNVYWIITSHAPTLPALKGIAEAIHVLTYYIINHSVHSLFTTFIPLGCTDGTIQLAGGPTSHQGRVEVCLSQEWGSVCDSNWTTADANVACRQLGFSRYSEWYNVIENSMTATHLFVTGGTTLANNIYISNISILYLHAVVA